jgi:hypothetical protein
MKALCLAGKVPPPLQVQERSLAGRLLSDRTRLTLNVLFDNSVSFAGTDSARSALFRAMMAILAIFARVAGG